MADKSLSSLMVGHGHRAVGALHYGPAGLTLIAIGETTPVEKENHTLFLL